MSKYSRLWIKFMEFGHWLGCHQIEKRSFSFRGYQFPLCARCTGVFVGHLVAFAIIFLGIKLNFIVALIFIGVMGIDWFIQFIEILYSNNYRRFTTGILAGIGITYVYFYAFEYIVNSLC